MEKKELKKKSENLSEWYTDVVLKAQLADYGPVRGTMVIRPYGYAIWEKVQAILDDLFKKAGVENAYFPLFIPYSLFAKEKEHVKGFAPELALVIKGGGEDLREPLVVRPTSETLMYALYAAWIHSWRDLPLLINQWNNCVRWEKRTYLFLRTLEFLWQEGHCAHSTHEESEEMVFKALDWYKTVYEDYYAIPVMAGRKSESEKFAGGLSTFCVEALMPDGKALQGATSHDLGQNFSKAQDISFQNKDGKLEFVWQNSWGFSTRTLGALFLVHGDDNGLVLPPKVAPIQVVLMPIQKADKDPQILTAYCQMIKETLVNGGVRVKIDDREEPSVGRRFNEWEVKGVPLRFEIGHQEAEGDSVTIVRRDTGEKVTIKKSEMLVTTEKLLAQIQKTLFARAKNFLEANTHEVNSSEEFKKIMATNRGFIRAFWCEGLGCEAKIKQETKATTRLLPINSPEEQGACVRCGQPATHRWIFAQAY